MPAISPLASRRPRRVIAIALLAVMAALVASPLPAAAKPGILPRGPGFAAWEVQIADIKGLGSPRPGLLVKAFSPGMDPLKYLDEAAKYNQKVLAYFTDTVNYNAGTVTTGPILGWARQVRSHPALYGYLSVKEPSWNRITLQEMRSLYSAYQAADPNHPVVALLGDTPNFGKTQNQWGPRVADVLWVDWYPVTVRRGYLGDAKTNFPKIRAYVAQVTPGTPIWLMVQGHAYRKGDLRSPTAAELRRQVSDGFRYLGAAGIAFYTWQNPLYESAFKSNKPLWRAAQALIVSNSGSVIVTR